jgi:Tol biopolymer transport system component
VRARFALVAVAVAATALPAAAETYIDFEVYSVNARGRVTNLTADPALDTSPSPSPDGTKIAFVSTRSGQPDLYVMRAAGGQATRLTTSPFDDQAVSWNDAGATQVAWSPDSKRLAFDVQNATFSPTCQTNCVTWSVYLINADGTGLHSIATEARAPAWSRDGRKLAYEDLVTPYGEALGVAIDGINGSRVRFRAYNANSSAGPVWSPRRDEVAFQANGAVHTVCADGTGRHRLARGRGPTWSPDGAALAFTRDGAIFRTSRAGTLTRRVAVVGAVAGQPAWSPGGRAIGVAARAGKTATQIVVLPAAGGRVLRLATADRLDSGPRWLGRTGSLVYARCICPG